MTPSEKPSSAERIRFNDWLANKLADRGFALAYIAEVDAQMMRQASQVAEAVAKLEEELRLARLSHAHGEGVTALHHIKAAEVALSLLKKEGTR